MASIYTFFTAKTIQILIVYFYITSELPNKTDTSRMGIQDFPGDPEVKTACHFQCRELGMFDPLVRGTKIPHVPWHSQKKKKRIGMFSLYISLWWILFKYQHYLIINVIPVFMTIYFQENNGQNKIIRTWYNTDLIKDTKSFWASGMGQLIHIYTKIFLLSQWQWRHKRKHTIF